MTVVDPIKDEPQTPPRAVCNPFATVSTLEPPRLNTAEPLWKQCGSRPSAQQLKLNEEAAEHSRKFFSVVEPILEEHRDDVTSCDTRLKEICQFYLLLL